MTTFGGDFGLNPISLDDFIQEDIHGLCPIEYPSNEEFILRSEEKVLEEFLETPNDVNWSTEPTLLDRKIQKKRKLRECRQPELLKEVQPQGNLKRRRFWREREYVLLSGITMTYFAGRHSMKEGKKEVKSTEKGVTTAWHHIHKMYEVARERLNLLYRENLPRRSANALRKKWKDSGKKAEGFKLSLDGECDTPDTIIRLVKFIKVYNKNFILTCSEARFQEIKADQS